MRIPYSRYLFLILLLPLMAAVPARADYQGGSYSQGELDELVGPIALYPDPLLAQVLPASTFVDEIQAAADYTNGGYYRSVDDRDWDISVRSLAHYPSVLRMMSTRIDWTTALGQAYIDQPDDVMDAIQRERQRALDYGYLRSTSQCSVVVESGGFIRIDPANAQYIYVPTYDPDIVFVRRPRNNEFSRNLVSFGLGLLIGSWLDRDTDWGHHRVYYHGWNSGGGWVARSRPHITINNIYVNNTFVNQPIRVNRTVTTRDITPYRTELKRNVGHLNPPITTARPQPTVVRTPQPQRGHVAGQTWTNRGNTGSGTPTPTPTSAGSGRNNPTNSRTQRSTGTTRSYQRGGSQTSPTVQSDRTPKSTSNAKDTGRQKSSDKRGKNADKSKNGNNDKNNNRNSGN